MMILVFMCICYDYFLLMLSSFVRSLEQLSFLLTVRYLKFAEELDSYQKQVEEVQYWGDIDEIYRYQRKAQFLEDRLIAAMDKIDKFNEEEVAFGWETTQYPLRKQIADRLQPYKKLFDSACEFLTKHDKWINSMIGTYSPEDIDNDVGNFYRSSITIDTRAEEKFERDS